jgi:hypothetical protein
MLYTLLFTAFIYCYTNVYYPEEYNTVKIYIKNKISDLTTFLQPKLIDFGYNTIYYYSCFQIKFNQFIAFLLPYFKLLEEWLYNLLLQYNIVSKKQANTKFTRIEFYNELTNRRDIYTIEKLYNKLEASDIDYNSECKLFVFYDNFNENPSNVIWSNVLPSDFNYKLSSVRFMLVQLTYNDVAYPLQLLTDSYNFYVTRNVIDKKFIKYYLTKFLKQEIEIDIDKEFTYKLDIIDNDANMVSYNETHSIIIMDNSYEVSTSK